MLPKYQAMVSLLVRRGFVVAVPQPPGHGETGGPYFESAGDCDLPNLPPPPMPPRQAFAR